jgi:hypothetical protein
VGKRIYFQQRAVRRPEFKYQGYRGLSLRRARPLPIFPMQRQRDHTLLGTGILKSVKIAAIADAYEAL